MKVEKYLQNQSYVLCSSIFNIYTDAYIYIDELKKQKQHLLVFANKAKAVMKMSTFGGHQMYVNFMKSAIKDRWRGNLS